MKNKSLSIITSILFLILQFLVLIGAVILEELSDKKMGVARYLAFKKVMYAETLFTPELLKVYMVILVGGCIICLVLFIVKVRKSMERKTRSLLLAAVYHLIGIYLLSAYQLSAYPFFLFGIMIVIIFQYAWMISIRTLPAFFQ